jgi:hypothetical protein
MIAAVYRALRPGGRFVAECGGHGCVDTVRTALVRALDQRDIDGEARVPWYFPNAGRLRRTAHPRGTPRRQHRPHPSSDASARRHHYLARDVRAELLPWVFRRRAGGLSRRSPRRAGTPAS